MLRARMEVLGKPEAVLRVETFELGPLAPGHVRVAVEYAPIDPMDLLSVRGLYPIALPLPGTPGAEGAGRVVAVGPGTALEVGAAVVLPIRAGSWASHVDVAHDDAVCLPQGTNLRNASMLRVDALSALALLESVPRGSVVVHAPGGGSVGRFLLQLASRFDVQVVALSERPERLEALKALGATQAFVLDAQAPGRVRACTDDRGADVVFDGIGGRGTAVLAACLRDGGEVVTYGAMSRESPVVPVMHPVFRDVRLRGFWLNRCTREWGPGECASKIRELAAAKLEPEIAGTYPLRELASALGHAADRSRRGRVLLRPDC